MPTEVLYFDTSYLVRLYLEDPGFKQVRTIAESATAIGSAWHAQAEIISAVHRTFRERELDQVAFVALLDQFASDSKGGLFQWLPLTESIQQRLEIAYRRAPDSVFLRAADALHLACAAEHDFNEVHSNDRRFLAAAPLFGLNGVNVIPD